MAIEKSTDVYLYKNGTSPTLRKSSGERKSAKEKQQPKAICYAI